MNLHPILVSSPFLYLKQGPKLLLFVLLITALSLQGQNNFNKEKDLFIAQFDSYPDSDDVHSQAAVGSLLAHPDFQGVNYLGVAGAYGNQPSNNNMQYIDTKSLFKIGFGEENADWIDAHADRVVNNDYTYSADFIADKAKPILQAGGKIWVMEAGQSNITADWVAELIAEGVTNTKTHVIVVQHSSWNEGQTNSSDLDYVKNNANYVQIDDGNRPYGTGTDRGDNTPDFEEEDETYMTQILSSSNPNNFTRTMWTNANDLALGSSYTYGPIPGGGIDFSDTCEVMWIFDLNHDYKTVQSFLDKFILNDNGDTGCIPLEVDGLVAVEAENFVSQSKTNIREWFIVDGVNITPTPDLDSSHHDSASGGAYLEILPDTRVTHDDGLIWGENITDTSGEMAVIDYNVNFTNPGKYYVWVRAYSTGSEDNGIHVGLNGNWPSTGNKMQWCEGKNAWTWASKQRTDANHCGEEEKIYIDIPSAGVHTISFSMREDGFEFDKFVLSQVYTSPIETGPNEVLDDCGGTEENNAPTVAIDTPANNASFEEGIDINFNANALDTDGTIQQVLFFVNGQLFKTEKAIPYTATLSGYAEGTYEITAIATDDDGATTTSSVVTIKIENEDIIAIPGDFEAENYTDITGSIRAETTPETSNENLGYIENNDSVEYEINVAESGVHTFAIYGSSESTGSKVTMYSNTTLVGTLDIPANGEWHDYQAYQTTATLGAGQQTLKFVFNDDSNGFLLNIDSISVTKGNALLSTEDIVYNSTITVFPNPALDGVNLKDVNEPLLVTVYNVLGEFQMEAVLDQGQSRIDISNLAPGMYLLGMSNITGDPSTRTFIKVVKL